MKKIALIALAAAATFPAAAMAQSAERPFTGAHVGVEASLDRLSVRNNPGQIGSTMRAKRDGVGYRIHAGYDVDLGGPVIGVEAGIGGGGRTVIQTGTTGRYSVDPGTRYDMSARAGIALGGAALIYGRGGYEWLKTDRTVAPNGSAGVTTGRTERGFLYGGGVEVAVTRNFSLRAEYDRANLSRDLRQSRISLGASVRF